MAGNRYLAFGLTIESAWPISSLVASENAFPGGADVEVVEGEVPLPSERQNIDGLQVSVDGRSCFIGIEECGRFQITDGQKIVVEPDPNATRDQVNLYLLGSVFGAVLHQRGMLPFHCNAVEVQGSAFLFCGDSGAGKSTLAAYFVERGFQLLADDLCALGLDSDGPIIAAPGAARLKLWEDTLRLLGKSSAGMRLVPWYQDKFEVPLTGAKGIKPLPVAAVYHLRTSANGRDPGIHRLKGLEAVNAVTANIYRRRLADLMGAAPSYLRATTRIVAEIPVFTMNRTWGLAHFRQEALAAEGHMRQIASANAASEEPDSKRSGEVEQ